MNRRQPPAFGLSFALHILCVMSAVSLGPRLVARPAPQPSARISGLTLVSVEPVAETKTARAASRRARPSPEIEYEPILRSGRPAPPLIKAFLIKRAHNESQEGAA